MPNSNWICDCCERECGILSTNFGEESPGPGQDLGPNWVEVAPGNFWLVDEAPPDGSTDYLEERGTAGGMVKCTVPHPIQHETGYMTLGIVGMTTGDAKSSFVFNYLDGDNYHYVSFERPLFNKWTVAVGKTTGGIASDIVSYSNDPATNPYNFSDGEFTICWGPTRDNGKIVITVLGLPEPGGTDLNLVTCSSFHEDGHWTGLRNERAYPVFWNLFVWWEHYQTNNICPHCICTCLGYCIPRTVTATMQNVSGCAVLDGEEVDLTLNLPSSDSGDHGLQLEWDHDNDDSITCGEHEFHIALHCCVSSGQGGSIDCTDTGGEIEPPGFRLVIGQDDPCIGGGTVYGSARPTSTCNPLSLVFGPFTITSQQSCNCCDGTINVIVTI